MKLYEFIKKEKQFVKRISFLKSYLISELEYLLGKIGDISFLEATWLIPDYCKNLNKIEKPLDISRLEPIYAEIFEEFNVYPSTFQEIFTNRTIGHFEKKIFEDKERGVVYIPTNIGIVEYSPFLSRTLNYYKLEEVSEEKVLPWKVGIMGRIEENLFATVGRLGENKAVRIELGVGIKEKIDLGDLKFEEGRRDKPKVYGDNEGCVFQLSKSKTLGWIKGRGFFFSPVPSKAVLASISLKKREIYTVDDVAIYLTEDEKNPDKVTNFVRVKYKDEDPLFYPWKNNLYYFAKNRIVKASSSSPEAVEVFAKEIKGYEEIRKLVGSRIIMPLSNPNDTISYYYFYKKWDSERKFNPDGVILFDRKKLEFKVFKKSFNHIAIAEDYIYLASQKKKGKDNITLTLIDKTSFKEKHTREFYSQVSFHLLDLVSTDVGVYFFFKKSVPFTDEPNNEHIRTRKIMKIVYDQEEDKIILKGVRRGNYSYGEVRDDSVVILDAFVTGRELFLYQEFYSDKQDSQLLHGVLTSYTAGRKQGYKLRGGNDV